MANNFSADSRCKALWRFESASLLGDSIGTNTFSQAGNPAADTIHFKEGASSIDLVKSSSQYVYRTNSNLTPGFPLKSGDTVKKGTWAFWFHPDILDGGGYYDLLCKGNWSTSERSLCTYLVGSILHIHWGEGGGYEEFTIGGFQINRFYHIGIRFDGVNKTISVRVWDDTAETVTIYNFTPSNALYVGGGDFRIGSFQPNTANCPDGQFDEVVIFNDLLSDTEIDAIRNGVFPLPPKIEIFQAVAQVEWESPPLIEVSQVIGQAEYQVPPLLKATQNLTQVEYSIPPLIKVPQIIGQVEYRQFDPGLYVKQFIVQVEYQEIPPLACRRKFPVPDARTAWQSQAGRRQFPVVQ